LVPALAFGSERETPGPSGRRGRDGAGSGRRPTGKEAAGCSKRGRRGRSLRRSAFTGTANQLACCERPYEEHREGLGSRDEVNSRGTLGGGMGGVGAGPRLQPGRARRSPPRPAGDGTVAPLGGARDGQARKQVLENWGPGAGGWSPPGYSSAPEGRHLVTVNGKRHRLHPAPGPRRRVE